ncbi:VOC family protein [Marinoscillum sp. MHG1-6]|uniref:VOC family protein n=1 Tax=Marinoscillum sp. MHG1-6 TaxID=2959627 RepID=UPI0021573347|nr:VOC family protein [Marinoscillum sp. MHG1-6]
MTIQNRPHLIFDGNCEAALQLYQGYFGGDIYLLRAQDTPMSDEFPPDKKSIIMFASLTGGKMDITAGEMSPIEGFKQGNDVMSFLSFTDSKEIRECYDHLKDGGEELDPLKEAFWGDQFGVVKDRYGKIWMLTLPTEKQ